MADRFNRPDDVGGRAVDGRLERSLRELGHALAMPAPSPAFASVVRARVQTLPPPGSVPSWRRWAGGTPLLRRSMLAGVAVLLLVATVAAAIGLGLPGIRILFGPPSSPGAGTTAQLSPSPDVSSPPGSSLGIGVSMPLADVAALTGFEPRLPADPSLGPPDASFVAGARLTLVWRTTADLPDTEQRGIGLLITEFRGAVDPGWYEKIVSSGETTVEPVNVGGEGGFWISGDPHGIVYRDASGAFVDESRRIVGDVLIWTDGDLTFRIETSLGREAAMRLAELMD